MIESIVAGLASGAASETAKELFKRIAIGLGTLLRARQAPPSAQQAVEKLERGEVDQDALRKALATLGEHDLSTIAADVEALKQQASTTNVTANLDFKGATVSGSTITGLLYNARER